MDARKIIFYFMVAIALVPALAGITDGLYYFIMDQSFIMWNKWRVAASLGSVGFLYMCFLMWWVDPEYRKRYIREFKYYSKNENSAIT